MTNKKLIGIGYDPATDAAPTIVLKGAGNEAESALAEARRFGGIPIVSDAQLVQKLYRLPVDAPVGRDLFAAMAALLIHVVELDQGRKEDPSP